MSEESDCQYYRRRAAEELAKARDALDPGLAAKHRQLSTIYTSRALQAERDEESERRRRHGGEGEHA
ncbi:MAG: hypothetical protein WBR13_02670 [Allosphingosinicella sp.]